MSVQQIIQSIFNKSIEKYFYNELVIGRLAHTETRANVRRGDEIDIIMPASVAMFDYDGGDLKDAEEAGLSITKVKLDKGKAFHFELSAVEEKQIEETETKDGQLSLARTYCEDAVKQFAAAVDTAFGNLYTRAGHYLDDNGSAITLTAQYAKEILAIMQAKFQRGDGKGHTNWVDGAMICIVPPEFQFYLGQLEDLKYVESGHKKMEKGHIGKLCGWDIYTSNNIAQPEDGVFYPMFGIAGKTLAGGISADMSTQFYIPEKNFNSTYKGYGLYGVGAPRADFLGTVKVKAPLSLSAAA